MNPEGARGVIACAPARHGAEPIRAMIQRACAELRARTVALWALDATTRRAARERAAVEALRVDVSRLFRAAVGAALDAGAPDGEVAALRAQWRSALAPPPRSSAPRCGARTRAGGACAAPPVWDRSARRPVNGRCRRHGGAAVRRISTPAPTRARGVQHGRAELQRVSSGGPEPDHHAPGAARAGRPRRYPGG